MTIFVTAYKMNLFIKRFLGIFAVYNNLRYNLPI